MDDNALKLAIDGLSSAYKAGGGNWIMLLPWIALSLIQLYKLPVFQEQIAIRFPRLAWAALRLRAQLGLAFLVGALPVLGGQLMLHVKIDQAAVLACFAGIGALVGFHPARKLANAVVAPVAEKLPSSASAAVRVVAPYDRPKIDQSRPPQGGAS